MLFFLYLNKQVASHAVVFSGITFTVDGNLHAFSYSCRDFYCNNLFAVNYSFAVTFLTLVFDYFSFTVTLRTYTLCLHHTEDALLCTCHTTCSVTCWTSLCSTIAFSA